jgi:osmotically-inducible protein OsmY
MAVRAERETKAEILAELRWELGTGAQDVSVEVQGPLAILTGRVATSDERRRVVAAVLRMPDVRDVVDGLGVVVSAGPAQADAALAREVRRAIEWESFAPDERIRAVVSKGWVTLHGSVDHLADAEDAERAVRRLVEARGVTNLMEVGWLGSDVVGLRRAIEASLARHAARAARHVRVSERAGGAALVGEVRSADEKEEVIAAAAHAARAARLIDEIRVTPLGPS